MVETVYAASPVNPQRRATAAEMEERARFLIDYAGEHGPVTVRQLYYRAEVEGLPGIDKTDAGYDKIQRQVLLLRRNRRLSYDDIADLTRWMRKPTSYSSVGDALRETARLYRKALWYDAGDYVEIWCEKDALAGVIMPVTALYDVPLMVARGFSSETFCFEAVEARAGDERAYHVYYLGDFDRAGRDAANALLEKLERFTEERDVEVNFVHLAIEEDDIFGFDPATGLAEVRLGDTTRRLPTRLHKRETAADQAWPHTFACELDAIEPDDLRGLVRWAIEGHLPEHQLKILKLAEQNERTLIAGLVGKLDFTDDA